MARFFRFLLTQLKRLISARIPLPASPLAQVMAGLTVLGVGCLGYLYGAAVMFFQWPSAHFLDEAFGGAKAWSERGRSTIPVVPQDAVVRKKEGITVDQADKTCDGFTLYTASDGTQATLIDMRGNVVHQWEMPFSQVWPHPPHVTNPLPDGQIHWFRCHLYPNGDLLAIYHADGDTPYGYGLVKLDKDSKLLWAYANNVHHDVDVGEDGTIYTLTQKIASQPMPVGPALRPVRVLADFLAVLSPEGQELESIPLLEALRDSPYALMLSSTTHMSRNDVDTAVDSASAPPAAMPSAAKDDRSKMFDKKGDLLHANSVRVLPRRLAAKFPLFQPGQVLISLRNLGILAVVDCKSRSVVWASGGVWQAQHDAEFLDNGNLLLYDNLGAVNRMTRILEYDPRTQAVLWCYASQNSMPLRASIRGMKQRLTNGNTLIVDPERRRLLEVTRDKEVVWMNFCPVHLSPGQPLRDHALTGASRYRPEELTFLKDVARPRP
jgi:hypothetical protein